jgi:hypothetical protein
VLCRVFAAPRTQKELKAAVDQLQAQVVQQVAALKRKRCSRGLDVWS